PTPVIFELWEGIERSERSIDEEKKVLAVLESFLDIPLNSKHAKTAGRKSGKLIKKGNVLDPIDILIGATAAAENETLITRDDDFEKIPQVEVEKY
ncbi:MAG: PIN domain-containing protein, partial [Candidatus Hadarchaeia archaeon]